MTNAETISAARGLFPGGVNSPVRSFRSVGGSPVPIARGEGHQRDRESMTFHGTSTPSVERNDARDWASAMRC